MQGKPAHFQPRAKMERGERKERESFGLEKGEGNNKDRWGFVSSPS